jgi:hypothetical protein
MALKRLNPRRLFLLAVLVMGLVLGASRLLRAYTITYCYGNDGSDGWLIVIYDDATGARRGVIRGNFPIPACTGYRQA